MTSLWSPPEGTIPFRSPDAQIRVRKHGQMTQLDGTLDRYYKVFRGPVYLGDVTLKIPMDTYETVDDSYRRALAQALTEFGQQ